MDLYFPDVKNPNESKEAFVKRFLASLSKSFEYAKYWNTSYANVLIVRSGMQITFWEALLYWRAPKIHNLPQTAQWACEALTNGGHGYEIGRCGGIDHRPSYTALFVKLPS